MGEDMELVVRIPRHCRERRRPYKVAFVPDPVAWTELPRVATPRHGPEPALRQGGNARPPYFFFLEVFGPIFGPVIEGLGYVTFAVAVILGRASAVYVVAFLAVALALGMALSFAAVGLEELSFRRYPRFRDIVRLLGVAVIENVGYRQLSTYWRVHGMVSKLRGAKTWGAVERRGFRAASPNAA